MTQTRTATLVDPNLDLVLERVIDVPRDLAWACWTQPEHLKQWFTPRPWTVTECEIDLRPGGVFRVLQSSPEGESMNLINCYLEVVPNQRLVWTEALRPGYRPSNAPFLDEVGHFTAVITFEALDANRTRYTAHVMHASQPGRDKHAEMGFKDGWGTSLDQMVEYAKAL